MRIAAFTAGLVVNFGVLLTGTAPASAAEPPTLDVLQRAVDTLPPGRVERPASYASMTAEVSDATFEAARTTLGGDRPLVDLIGTLAIYQMSAMLTALDRTGLADGAQLTLRPLE